MRYVMQSSMKLIRMAKRLSSQYSTAGNVDYQKARINYEQYIGNRESQAKRSVVVQVNSEKSFPELYNYCTAFGSIVNAQHFATCNRDDKTLNYILLEFATIEMARAALDASCYNAGQVMAVRSPFLWFRTARQKLTSGDDKQLKITAHQCSVLNSVNGTRILQNNELDELLFKACSINEQILLLYEHTKLNDLGARMRFISAFQLQEALCGMFSYAQAKPFGSTVNGFGKMGCDLDLIMCLAPDAVNAVNDESRLVFHTKENQNGGRTEIQRHMEIFSDIFRLYLPGVCNVRPILRARVPIIKYYHEHLDLEVDFSMSNMSGCYMSELFYILGELDTRVRPLAFAVRRWALSCGLMNRSPGNWITNFSLTCLVIYFLQRLIEPILPSIYALAKHAIRTDVRSIEHEFACNFARDFERIDFVSKNNEPIGEILKQFFEFYANFDFNEHAIFLNRAIEMEKPSNAAMHIVNPLEPTLNVSKNVSMLECQRIQREMREAAFMLEEDCHSNKGTQQWGLLRIFKQPNISTKINTDLLAVAPRMVEVSDLFTTTSSDKTYEIKYKNATVRRQVQGTKAHTCSELKGIQAQAAGMTAASAQRVKPKKGSHRGS